jgi:hypothetical protein
MTTPSHNYPNPLCGAISELMSARAALTMEPSALKSPHGPYLCDTDYWANHAMDHLWEVTHHLDQVNEKIYKIADAVQSLMH